MAVSNPENFGAYIPSTYAWDVEQLQNLNIQPPGFKELLIRLYQNVNQVTLGVNNRVSGYLYNQEFVSGKQFFPNPTLNSQTPQSAQPRQIYSLVVVTGQLPNTGTTSTPHGLTPNSSWQTVSISGAASDTTGFNYITLPYASATGAPIEVSIDAVNVVITTTSNRSNFNFSYIIWEYFKF